MQGGLAPRLAAVELDAGRGAAVADAWRALWTSRLLVCAAGIVAVAAFGLAGRAPAFDPAGLTAPFGASGDLLAASFARWDSVWYLAIAGGGYGEDARAAFFPLYPLAAKLAGLPLGSALLGGVLVSTAALAAALVTLHRLVALDHGRETARVAVLICALQPMAFFFSAVYSESLFLALSIGAVYAARIDRWAWAGTLGALAAGTRSAGVLLVVALGLIALYGGRPLTLAVLRSPRSRRRGGGDIRWVALVPMGLAAYCAFLALDGLDPLSPFAAQDVWLRSFAGPLVGVWDGAVAAFDGTRQLLSGSRTPVLFTQAGGDPLLVARHNIELAVWLVVLVPAVIGVLRRLPLAYGGYLVAALALPLSYPVAPQPLMSLPRFAVVLFPLVIWLALWAAGHPWRLRALLVLGVAGLIVYTGLFATWHWVA